MGRYIEDAGINQPLDVVSAVMEDYIYHERFSRTDWNGEPVYRCTDAAGKERYLVWSYASGIFHVEAWMKGPFGDEMDLTGVGKSRKEYKESIDKLIQTLRNHSGDTRAGRYVGQDPLQHHSTTQQTYSQPTQTYSQPSQTYTRPTQTSVQPSQSAQGSADKQSQPVYRENWMNGQSGNGRIFQQPSTGQYTSSASGAGNQYMIIGIIALVTAFLFSIMGLILGIYGLRRYGSMEVEPSEAGKAKAGRICCISAIVFGLIIFLMNFILPFAMVFFYNVIY